MLLPLNRSQVMFHRRRRTVQAKPLGFAPPPFSIDRELEWVLQRAFGPLTWSATSVVGGERAVRTALRLDLAARIAVRHRREILEKEVGSVAAQRLREQYIGVVGREALLERALDLLLEQAKDSSVPCILLKYAALNRMGALQVGARSACDIDVLVPEVVASRFQASLVRSGYTQTALPDSAHQLAPLQDPNGALIEVHLHIPGITLCLGQPFVSADELISAGLTRQIGDALVPDVAIVTAHALAHGWVQHARAPHMYSALKTCADLADLARAGCGDFEAASAFLLAAMTEGDLAAALSLTRALLAGDLESAMAGPSGVLLRHALASQLDRDYAARLRLRLFTQPGLTSQGMARGRLLRALREVWFEVRSRVARVRGGS